MQKAALTPVGSGNQGENDQVELQAYHSQQWWLTDPLGAV